MFSLISFFILLTGSSHADLEKFLVNEKDMAIYVHPYSAIEGAVSHPSVFNLQLTFENELGRGSSVVLASVLATSSIQEDSVHGALPPRTDVFGIGIAGSLREYFNGVRSTGVYGAPSMAFLYAKVNRPASSKFPSQSSEAIVFGVGASLGARAKWEWFTTFFEAGIGYQWGIVNGDSGTDGDMESGFTKGASLGVGVPF